MDAPDPHKTKSSDIAFRDPLSDETRKVRTHLLFAGALAVLVKTYDLKITKAPWLDLEIPVSAPQILEGGLSIALSYTLFVFILYGWQDFRRWRLAGEIHLVQNSANIVHHSREHLRLISMYLEKLSSGQEVNSGLRSAVDAASAFLPDAQVQLASLGSALRRLNRLQWFRIVVVDYGLPVALGAFGLCKIGAAVLPFVLAVAK